jgi:hypothetical protein
MPACMIALGRIRVDERAAACSCVNKATHADRGSAPLVMRSCLTLFPRGQAGKPAWRIVWSPRNKFWCGFVAPKISGGETRLSEEDPVPNEIWEEAARHYDEPALAALLLLGPEDR